MGWIDYYKLLKKYKGDLRSITPGEKRLLMHNNPRTPKEALAVALEKYRQDNAKTT